MKTKETPKRITNWNATAEIQAIAWEVVDESGVMNRLEQINQCVDALTKQVDELKRATSAIEEIVTVLMAKITN